MIDVVADVSLESGSIVGEGLLLLLSMIGRDAPFSMS